jgi:hypothetical protein
MVVVSGYNFQIDMQCPQCGAPVVLNETEYIIQCSFCRTCNIIHTHPYPCYYMEPRQKKYSSLKIAYVPYWRFKGLEFTLGKNTPRFRVIDNSYLAVHKTLMPPSMGLRAQTQKLKFLHKGITGSFLPPAISRKEILQQIGGSGDKKVHIGEILSLIFMPFYQDRDVIYDGLTGKSVSMHPSDPVLNLALNLAANKKSPAYNLKFTPSICPNCGWDLKGETDSLVLHCNNCMSFWMIRNNLKVTRKKLNRLKAMFFDSKSDMHIQIPFWRLQIEFSNLECSTYAHLTKIANIPRIVKSPKSIQPNNIKKDEQQILYFYIPAFKLNPKLFLRIGKQVTLAGIEPPMIEPSRTDNIPQGMFHPVDLPVEEGLQAVGPVLMNLSANKKNIWNLLEKEKFKLKTYSLVYVPFYAAGSEYIQKTLGFSIQKNSLKFGRQL